MIPAPVLTESLNGRQVFPVTNWWYQDVSGARVVSRSAQFIDWITTPEVQQKHVLAFQPDCEELPHSCTWRQLITVDAKTFPPTDQAFTKELMDGFFEIQDGIIAGRISPEDGAAMMDERAEAWKSAKG